MICSMPLLPPQFAELMIKTIEIREGSWVKTGRYVSSGLGRYSKSIPEACAEAVKRLGVGQGWVPIATYALTNASWVEVQEWARDNVNHATPDGYPQDMGAGEV